LPDKLTHLRGAALTDAAACVSDRVRPAVSSSNTSTGTMTASVLFDIFRVADGKLAEHWDALTPQVATTVSGRTQTDGTTEVTDRDATDANRKLVAGFVETVLKGGKTDTITDYLSTERSGSTTSASATTSTAWPPSLASSPNRASAWSTTPCTR
jgi:hypothetical protein